MLTGLERCCSISGLVEEVGTSFFCIGCRHGCSFPRRAAWAPRDDHVTPSRALSFGLACFLETQLDYNAQRKSGLAQCGSLQYGRTSGTLRSSTCLPGASYPSLRCDDFGGAQPVRLHSRQPLTNRVSGKPTVLITSGEHYGAVLIWISITVRYLDTLRSDGLNLHANIRGQLPGGPRFFNSKAIRSLPQPTRFIAPWLRSENNRPPSTA